MEGIHPSEQMVVINSEGMLISLRAVGPSLEESDNVLTFMRLGQQEQGSQTDVGSICKPVVVTQAMKEGAGDEQSVLVVSHAGRVQEGQVNVGEEDKTVVRSASEVDVTEYQQPVEEIPEEQSLLEKNEFQSPVEDFPEVQTVKEDFES